MRPYLFITLFLSVVLVSYAIPAGDAQNLRENKKELEQIKKQLSDTKGKIDSLKTVENNLQKAISRYGERVSRNRKLVDRMRRDLKAVKGDISHNDSLLHYTDDRLLRKRENYTDMLVDFYTGRRMQSALDPLDFSGRMSQSRRRLYLAAVSGTTTREMIQVGDSIRLLSGHIDSLQKHDADLNRLRREKEARINLDKTLRKKEETSLGSVRRQSTLLRDRLVSLSEVAREMEDIIARLEEVQRQRRQDQEDLPRFSSESFAGLKGALIPPIKGKIVSTFGWKTDPTTKLKSFAPGIDIKPTPGPGGVSASAPGRVVYVGSLRGYSNFVILEHDDDYFTTYAGLSGVTVELDDVINVGRKLGDCGTGNMHFEIRKGREHLDPVIWLDIDGF
ncbi:MAG: peptidoglycan DD-metalloendopeptidase family protein [FCB group bacterium]|nr:peptidoglycan DD-metalloendopeptidase family protein [FCB group bacterium]